MVKNTVDTFKRQTGRKMFATHTIATGLISLQCKGFLGNKKKKMNYPIDKWTQDLNRALGGKRNRGGLKHIERYSPSHILRLV